MNWKIGIILGVIGGLSIIAISYIFAEPKNPTADEYIKMKVRIKMLEKQMRIMESGWQGCLQEYENLMFDCKNSCNGKI